MPKVAWARKKTNLVFHSDHSGTHFNISDISEKEGQKKRAERKGTMLPADPAFSISGRRPDSPESVSSGYLSGYQAILVINKRRNKCKAV